MSSAVVSPTSPRMVQSTPTVTPTVKFFASKYAFIRRTSFCPVPGFKITTMANVSFVSQWKQLYQLQRELQELFSEKVKKTGQNRRKNSLFHS